jgi:hypothetical protein
VPQILCAMLKRDEQMADMPVTCSYVSHRLSPTSSICQRFADPLRAGARTTEVWIVEVR